MGEYTARLTDLLDAIRAIRDNLHGIGFSDYQQNRALRRATERELEIISEASRHIPEEIKHRYPNIPWRAVADIGNKLRHEYYRIKDTIIWSAANLQLNELERFCEKELARLRDSHAANGET